MHEAIVLATHSATPVARIPFNSNIEEILSLIGDGVVSINQDGQIILFNRAAELLFGYTSAELLGCPIEVLIPMRFHDMHRKDVKGFISVTATTNRSMGNNREVMGRHKNGREFSVEATLSRLVYAGQLVFMVVVRDVTERKTAEQQHRLIVEEVAHRLRNTMAVVGSIVSLTARHATSLPDFVSSLLGRINAISRTNNSLIGERCVDSSLRGLLHSELAAFELDETRFKLNGPDVVIEGKLVFSLGLVFHELATNAAKYGAFSIPGGEVEVNWHVDFENVPTLSLRWQESGGPSVNIPTRKGFGSQLVERILNSYMGKAEIHHHTNGVVCLISVPLVTH